MWRQTIKRHAKGLVTRISAAIIEEVIRPSYRAISDRLQVFSSPRQQAPHPQQDGAVHSREDLYEALYEHHGAVQDEALAVGGPDFDLTGRIELGILLAEGLKPKDTVFDFGCGTGRLAVQLIPCLVNGRYIGVDIAQSMLDKARPLIAHRIPNPTCEIVLRKDTSRRFFCGDGEVDIVCAFSVFTHMEHEDAYQYLLDGLRITRPGGKFIFSCLPMSLPSVHGIFVDSSRAELSERWSRIRSVTTSVDLMESISRLAGWKILRWYRGDEVNIPMPDSREMRALGQSTCVLQKD